MNTATAIFSNCILAILLFINCKKEKTGNDPVMQVVISKRIKILEYGSNVPIANATLTTNACLSASLMWGCTAYKELKSWTSEIDGTVTIFKNQVSTNGDLLIAKEENHWTLKGIWAVDTLIQQSTYDSLVMRMYPHSWIKFHFKSNSSFSAKEHLRVYMLALPDNKIEFEIESPFIVDPLANNLDIRLTHKTYGNVKNKLVCELLDSNFNYIKTVLDQTKFFAKGDTLTWNITY